MKIKIITLGKFKETYWQEAEAEYLKRLGPYTKIEIIELPEEPFSESSDKEKIKTKEAEKIKKHLNSQATIIALTERGKLHKSTELAEHLEKKTAQGHHLIFIIGGPLGLHQSILDMTKHQLSLSPLTFPHQLARVILLEQLYRVGTILTGKTYHY